MSTQDSPQPRQVPIAIVGLSAILPSSTTQNTGNGACEAFPAQVPRKVT